MRATIVVHGGAGFLKEHLREGRLGVGRAAEHGAEFLKRGGSAVDAVEVAVVTMEDDPTFNAGKGSSLTAIGTVEMDAAIMDGRDLSAGAVTLVRTVKNPVRLSRLVMEKTGHVLLAGEHAERLAKAFGLPRSNPITRARRDSWRKLQRDPSYSRPEWVRKNLALLKTHPEIQKDTVGAVAVDEDGNLAAAASTGGITLKMPGRIGDTPQIGCGLYSDNRSGSTTATGLGEVAIKLAVSKMVCEMLERGIHPDNAVAVAVRAASRRLRGEMGIIAIDRMGRIAAANNTRFMPWAFSTAKRPRPRVKDRGRIVAPLF